MNFSIWNESIHLSEKQQKRLKTAQKSECTPLSVDTVNKTGVFSGRHGRYNVTLDTCTCGDFIRNRLPCKHIYRLAIELDCVDLEAKSDPSKVKSPPSLDSLSLSELVEKTEHLSEKQQLLVKSILLETLFRHKDPIGLFIDDDILALIDFKIIFKFEDKQEMLSTFSRNELNKKISSLGIDGFKKNMSLSNLVKWCLENIYNEIDEICQDVITVKFNPLWDKNKRKLYTYLRRKYDFEIAFDGENTIESPAGSSLVANGNDLYYAFPDDEVTRLLNRYNCNPLHSNDD